MIALSNRDIMKEKHCITKKREYNSIMFINNFDFDETIKKEWSSPVMYDGITNIERYKKVNPKILWILKETNENGKKDNRDHREFHVDVTVYPY